MTHEIAPAQPLSHTSVPSIALWVMTACGAAGLRPLSRASAPASIALGAMSRGIAAHQAGPRPSSRTIDAASIAAVTHGFALARLRRPSRTSATESIALGAIAHGIVLALLALPAIALAQPAATAVPATMEHSPDMIYAAALGRGLSAVRAGDRGGAIAAFREAVQLEPSRPDAVCFLAEAQRASGDLAAALEGFQACARIARNGSQREAQRWLSRALHGVASTLERMGPERHAEARTAWQEYVRFADGAAQVSSPAIGRARVTVIDQVTELERVTAEVRQRIAARAAQAESSSPRPR